MSILQDALNQSLEEGNIDILLPALLESHFYLICQNDEEGEFPIFLTPSPNSNHMCVTVGESENALGDFLDQPHLAISEINGQELLALAQNEMELVVEEDPDSAPVVVRLEIMIMFDDGQAYCIPRGHIDWWFQNYAV